MISINLFNRIIDMALILVSLLLFISVLIDRTSDRESRRKFLNVICLAIMFAIIDLLIWSLEGTAIKPEVSRIIHCIYTVVAYFLVATYIIYQLELLLLKAKTIKILNRVTVITCILFCSVAMLLVLSGRAYTVTDRFEFIRGEAWYMLYVFPLFGMLFSCIITLFSKGEPSVRLALATYCVIPALSEITGFYNIGISTDGISVLLGLIIIYIFCYVEKGNAYLNAQYEMESNKARIMLSQIQPHFLFNALSATVSLCHTDPEEAAEAITEFSRYLRGNIDAIGQDGPIAFADELKHIKAYLKIEKRRLQDALTVEYRIHSKDFSVPALSIQPLVENAVKHGINESGKFGKVTLTTEEDEKSYYITVEDDGAGFDVTGLFDGSRNHVGIQNVRLRVERMCGGKLEVISSIGHGTVSKITIPKNPRGKIYNENSRNR